MSELQMSENKYFQFRTNYFKLYIRNTPFKRRIIVE